MKIAILGSGGFLGSGLCNVLREKFDVQEITRSNYISRKGEEFDVFINANGNSRRHWANNNVIEDFDASTVSVYRTFLDFRSRLYIYISSADVYVDHSDVKKTKEDTVIDSTKLCPYGFHKYLSELIVKKFSRRYLILRCSALIGQNIRKGPVKDILDNKPLFISLDSRLQFISTSEVGKIVIRLIKNDIANEIFNVGGIGTLTISSLEKILDKELHVHETAEKQVYELNVNKLNKIFPVKRSEEYIKEFLTLTRGA